MRTQEPLTAGRPRHRPDADTDAATDVLPTSDHPPDTANAIVHAACLAMAPTSLRPWAWRSLSSRINMPLARVVGHEFRCRWRVRCAKASKCTHGVARPRSCYFDLARCCDGPCLSSRPRRSHDGAGYVQTDSWRCGNSRSGFLVSVSRRPCGGPRTPPLIDTGAGSAPAMKVPRCTGAAAFLQSH